MLLLELQSFFKEKAKSYYEGIHNLAIQSLSFGMDMP